MSTPKTAEAAPRTRRRWESWARWPGIVATAPEQNSMDEHDTEEQATATCRMLERDGLGGEKKVFPVRTWVLPPNDQALR